MSTRFTWIRVFVGRNFGNGYRVISPDGRCVGEYRKARPAARLCAKMNRETEGADHAVPTSQNR